jgi:spore coat protein CotH
MKIFSIRPAVPVLITVLAAARLVAQAPVPAPVLTADDLFDPNTVHEIRLTVNTRDWAELRERYQENIYYLADLRWRDQVVRNIGIRSRGAFSRNADKPGLRVDFDRYAMDQEFLGLKSLVLDNLTQDASMLKERVIMRFFNEMGIAAPREVHARLFLNDEYLGLYAIVESIDKRFLKRRFDQNDGYLFEFHRADSYGLEDLGPELEAYTPFFEPKTHEHDSMATLYGPIRELVRAINESSDSLFAAEVGRYLDLPTFLKHVAIENFVADIDGLVGVWGMNNFYLYRFEDQSLSQLVPWDKDNSFYAADWDIWRNVETNVLTRRTLTDPSFRNVYLEALRECAALALRGAEPPSDSRVAPGAEPAAGWLEREVSFVVSQIRPFALDDGKKPVSNERFEEEVAKVLEFSRARPLHVQREVADAR